MIPAPPDPRDRAAGAPPPGSVPSGPPPDAPRAPAEVRTSTIWVWLIIGLGVLTLVPLHLIDVVGWYENLLAHPLDDAAIPAILGDPWMIATLALNTAGHLAYLLFAFLDHRALRARGVPRPFGWGWMAFSFAGAGNLVYVLGRSVVLARRTRGRGLAPLWTLLAVNAAGIVVLIAWWAALTAEISAVIERYT